MDSRQLYIAANQLSSRLEWEREWIHFGTGKDVKFELVEVEIMSFLTTPEVQFVYSRTTSGLIKRQEILMKIKPLVGVENFQIWNFNMSKAIQFNRIGVLLKGKKAPS